MLGLLIGAAIASDLIDSLKEEIGGTTQKYGSSDLVTLTLSSQEFLNQDYKESLNILRGIGFSNIHLQEIRQYRDNFFNQGMYGKVASVSINGISSFGRRAKFPRQSYVVLSVHVFKTSPPLADPLVNDGPAAKVQQLNRRMQDQNLTPVRHYENEYFCEYCGRRVPRGMWTCPGCGAPVTKV